MPVLESTAPIDRATILALQGETSCSIPMIQRRLHLGYVRAKTLIEELVGQGVIGPRGEGGQHAILRLPAVKK